MNEFNLILIGYGGQGVLTIADIIAEASMKESYEIKQAELHGLAQRGGSLNCHIRFGDKIDSPLVKRRGADLIIALDAMEALRAAHSYANKDTRIIINKKTFGFPDKPEDIIKQIKKITENVVVVDADPIVRELTGQIMAVNIYMLGVSVKHKILPFSKQKVWEAIEEKIAPRFLEEDKKAFEAGFN